MWLFRFGVPVLGILGFGYAVYEVVAEKEDPEKMGLAKNILKMFGVGDLIIALCWLGTLVGLAVGAGWAHAVAIFATGMFCFDFLVALPIYKNLEDHVFKYWAGAALILQIVYCIWL